MENNLTDSSLNFFRYFNNSLLSARSDDISDELSVNILSNSSA